MDKRKFSKEEKLSILIEANEQGVKNTLDNMASIRQLTTAGKRSLRAWPRRGSATA